MPKRDKRHLRIIFLGSLILLLIFIYISRVWLFPTISRYIKRDQDEIRAHYTSLYFASTGEGKTIALEDNVGYIDFDLRNYVGENVTQRDIVYTISKPTEFYTSKGDPIPAQNLEEEAQNDNLHVLDVWGQPKKVAKNTYLYDVEIVKNSGEVIGDKVYTFSYEQLGASAKGKVHTLTCKVQKINDDEVLDDTISLVVQLSKPYKEVLIINMKVSNRLITFSHKEINMFDVIFDKIYIQTIDLFAYHKGPEKIPRIQSILESSDYYKYTSYAFKLTITWNGYILDENKLENIHIGTSSYPGDIKHPDTSDGTTPNPNVDAPYIDITQSTIAKINSVKDENGHSGELVIFVPQGSDINLHFLKTSTSGSIDVKIEAYVTYVSGNTETSGYQIYSQSIFGGYLHNLEDKYNLANYSN